MTSQASAARAAGLDPRSEAFVEELGQFLLQQGTLDELAVHRAQRAQRQSGERFDLVLTRLGLVPEANMARLLAEFLGVALADAKDLPEVALLADRLQLSFLMGNRIIPLAEQGDTLVVAAADPFNREPIEAIGYLLGRPVEQRIMGAGEIERALERLYGRGATVSDEAAPTASERASEDDVRRLEDMASEAPIIRLVHDMIARAVEAQASDIHVEPREDSLRVRFRLDGMLHTVETLPLSLRAAVTSRIKIMANLNIAERRLPQDGRIKTTVRGREIDLRISTMPTLSGESVVHAHPRPLQRAARFHGAGLCRAGARGVRQAARPAERHHPGHRPDRQRQDDHALHGAQRAEHGRAQDLHGRGPDRIPAGRRQPDAGAAEDRPDLRARPCAPSCARTPTSSWSARSATWRRRRWRSRPR